jgi:predicted ATPase
MNREDLNNLAKEIQETKQSKKITPRELLNAFGFERRTSGRCDTIDHWLDNNNLLTDPDYINCYIDQYTSLCYKYEIKSNKFQLYYLEIRGYKNLVNFSVDLEPTNNYCCFIGLNGSGKSNVLEAISLIFYSLYQIATLKDGLKKYSCKFQYTIRYIFKGQLYEISDGILKDGRKITTDILPKNILASYSGEDTRLWKECYKPLYDKYCSKMVATQGFEPPFMFYLSRYEWEISLLTLLYSEDIDVIKFIKELVGTSSCKISFDYNTSNIRKWEGTEIEGFIDKLKEKSAYDIESFRETINDISFIDKASTLFYCLYKCRTEGGSQIIKKINIEFDNRGSLEGLSEGEKKLINANVVIHILSTEDSLCLFDEPDAHIHIGKQRDLKELIDTDKRYSIVTTHSPVFLNDIKEENIRSLKKGVLDNMEKLQQITELSSGLVDYFNGSLFLNSNAPLILVEGIGDINYIKKAIYLLSTNHDNYSKISWDFLFMGGAGENAKQFIDKISPHINEHRKVVVVFDRDSSGAEAMSKLGCTENRCDYHTYKKGNWYYIMLPKTAEHTNIDFTIEDYFSLEHKKKIAIEKINNSGGFFKKLPKDLRQNVKDTLSSKIEMDKYTYNDMEGFSVLIDKILNILDGIETNIKEVK